MDVSTETLRAMQRPVLYHYDPAFLEIFARTEGLLKQVFRTEYDVVIMQALQTRSAAGGFVTRSWHVFGGYTIMDGKIAESNTPGEVGRRMINTPKHSVSMWTTWSIQRLQLGGGVRYAAKRYGNLINTRSVDGYATADATASYRLHRFVDLRLNVYNFNNAFYFDRLGGGHLVPGPGRSAVVGTTFHF